MPGLGLCCMFMSTEDAVQCQVATLTPGVCHTQSGQGCMNSLTLPKGPPCIDRVYSILEPNVSFCYCKKVGGDVLQLHCIGMQTA